MINDAKLFSCLEHSSEKSGHVALDVLVCMCMCVCGILQTVVLTVYVVAYKRDYGYSYVMSMAMRYMLCDCVYGK